MLCISGFLVDIVFSYYEPNGGASLPQQHHYSVCTG